MAQTIVRAKPLPVYTPTFTNLVHSTHTYSPVKMEQTECSKTSAFKTQTPGNYPKEIILQVITFHHKTTFEWNEEWNLIKGLTSVQSRRMKEIQMVLLRITFRLALQQLMNLPKWPFFMINLMKLKLSVSQTTQHWMTGWQWLRVGKNVGDSGQGLNYGIISTCTQRNWGKA
jgi:hypothetical protein